jgi:hypothetical protein
VWLRSTLATTSRRSVKLDGTRQPGGRAGADLRPRPGPLTVPWLRESSAAVVVSGGPDERDLRGRLPWPARCDYPGDPATCLGGGVAGIGENESEQGGMGITLALYVTAPGSLAANEDDDRCYVVGASLVEG